MIIAVNYRYKVRYLPNKRCRKEREFTIPATEMVDIKELAPNNFPVALIVHDYKSVMIGMKYYFDYENCECQFRMFDEEIRTHNGRLYSPCRVTHGAAISTEFVDLREIKYQLERSSLYYNLYTNSADTDRLPNEAVIIISNQDEMIANIRKDAEKYILCNGVFWEECGEPRYLINTFGLGHNHGGTSMFIEYGYNPNISNKNYFNALQREEAIAYGKAVAARRGDTEYIDSIGKYDNIEVLMPEVIHVEPEKQHGDGDKLMNEMEELIDASDSVLTAGLLCIARACKDF